jgi:hypothetical protein
MANKHVTAVTIPVCVIESDKILRVNVDKERQFTLTCFILAIRTFRKSEFWIWIEGKIIFGR